MNLMLAIRVLILIAIFFSSCQVKESGQHVGTAPDAIEKEDSENVQPEFVTYDKVKLDGILDVITDMKIVVKLLGKPDSIVSPEPGEECITYFDSYYQYIYYSGIIFEKYHDTLVLKEIEFPQIGRHWILFNQAKLNEETSIDEIRSLFPRAAMNIYPIDNSNDQGIMLDIAKEAVDDKWILVFRNNKLLRLSNYAPC